MFHLINPHFFRKTLIQIYNCKIIITITITNCVQFNCIVTQTFFTIQGVKTN